MQTVVGLGSLEGCMVPGTGPAPADCSSFLPNINSFGNLRATVPILTLTKTDYQRRKEARQELLPLVALGGNIGNEPTFVSESMASLVLQPQILAKVFQAALVVAAAGPGLMAPSPPGPGQHRFVQRHGPPDQPVQQAAHLGNRQWYQGFIPLRFSPFFPLKQALAFCRTTAR